MWYVPDESWKSVAKPKPIATSPERVSAPWLTTCASIRSSAAPSRTSARPVHAIGSTARPKSASRSADRAERAGEDDARMQDLEADAGEAGEEEQRDRGSGRAASRGSLREEARARRRRSRRPRCASVWPIGTVLRPSTCFRSAGRLGEITSMTFIFSASAAERFEATRTALSAQAALRPCVLASPRSDAAASLMILRRRSLPMFGRRR